MSINSASFNSFIQCKSQNLDLSGLPPTMYLWKKTFIVCKAKTLGRLRYPVYEMLHISPDVVQVHLTGYCATLVCNMRTRNTHLSTTHHSPGALPQHDNSKFRTSLVGSAI
jgi:hypothetical protein